MIANQEAKSRVWWSKDEGGDSGHVILVLRKVGWQKWDDDVFKGDRMDGLALKWRKRNSL